MDDVRHKLFPVFSHEVRAALPVIDTFLGAHDSQHCELSALETAIRAIHTLKDSAESIGAGSVTSVAVRMENILARHLRNKSCPTQVEYDALSFARQKMSVLVNCFELAQAEPPYLLSGVLHALDLATAFPGQPVSVSYHNDSIAAEDPFAEDAVFDFHYFEEDVGSSFDEEQSTAVSDATVPGRLPPLDDPFADDHRFDLLDSRVCIQAAPASGKKVEPLCFDPFAEDPDF